MKKLLVVAVACAAFGLAPLAASFGLVVGSAWIVALGVALALAATGGIEAVAIAAGATGALAGTMLGVVHPAVGSAVFVALAFGERTIRVRGTQARLLHVAAAAGAGALAGALANAYLHAAFPVRVVATLVCGVLTALPLLIDADDPIAHALGSAAPLVPEPARAALAEGAELRRHAADIPLERSATRTVRGTWKALVRLAEARIRLDRASLKVATGTPNPAAAVIAMVDQRIVDHVKALSRAYTAADTARAAAVGLDDAALKTIGSVGDSLEDVSRAMMDIDDANPARTRVSNEESTLNDTVIDTAKRSESAA